MGWLELIKSFVGQKVDSATDHLLILDVFTANDGTKDHPADEACGGAGGSLTREDEAHCEGFHATQRVCERLAMFQQEETEA